MTACQQQHGRSLLLGAILIWVLAQALGYAQDVLLNGFRLRTAVLDVLLGPLLVLFFASLLWRGDRWPRWVVVGLFALQSVLGFSGFFLGHFIIPPQASAGDEAILAWLEWNSWVWFGRGNGQSRRLLSAALPERGRVS
jgi:hypothetical protein